jgi:TIR domain
MTGQCARFLEASVVADLNIVTAGATQAGKTTLLIVCEAHGLPLNRRQPGRPAGLSAHLTLDGRDDVKVSRRALGNSPSKGRLAEGSGDGQSSGCPPCGRADRWHGRRGDRVETCAGQASCQHDHRGRRGPRDRPCHLRNRIVCSLVAAQHGRWCSRRAIPLPLDQWVRLSEPGSVRGQVADYIWNSIPGCYLQPLTEAPPVRERPPREPSVQERSRNQPARAPGVFISYRRQDTPHLAGRLYDRLGEHFGQERVFMDVDSIEPGLDFGEVIKKAVSSSAVMLVLIGDKWLTTTDPRGRQRLDNPDDYVRLELEAALAREMRVIPVLVEGAAMPGTQELPASVAGLARRNALEVSHGRFSADAERLVLSFAHAEVSGWA